MSIRLINIRLLAWNSENALRHALAIIYYIYIYIYTWHTYRVSGTGIKLNFVTPLAQRELSANGLCLFEIQRRCVRGNIQFLIASYPFIRSWAAGEVNATLVATVRRVPVCSVRRFRATSGSLAQLRAHLNNPEIPWGLYLGQQASKVPALEEISTAGANFCIGINPNNFQLNTERL